MNVISVFEPDLNTGIRIGNGRRGSFNGMMSRGRAAMEEIAWKQQSRCNHGTQTDNRPRQRAQ